MFVQRVKGGTISPTTDVVNCLLIKLECIGNCASCGDRVNYNVYTYIYLYLYESIREVTASLCIKLSL